MLFLWKLVCGFILFILGPLALGCISDFLKHHDLGNLILAVILCLIMLGVYFVGFNLPKRRAFEKKQRAFTTKQQAEHLVAFNQSLNEWQKKLAAMPLDNLPSLQPAEYHYRAVGNEKLLGVHSPAILAEIKNTGSYSMTQTGTSEEKYKYALGLREYSNKRYGEQMIYNSSAKITPDQVLNKTIGRLIITSTALAFEGDGNNARFAWDDIVGVDVFINGVNVKMRVGTPHFYAIEQPQPAFLAMLMRMTA